MNLFVVSTFLVAIKLCLGANILFLIPMPSRSHYNLGDRLIRELINKGHQVTVISPFEMSDPPKKNLTQITVDLKDKFKKQFILKNKKEKSFGLREMSPFSFLFLSNLGELIAEATLESDEVQAFIKKNDENFDLIIGECFLVEGVLGGFSHKFKAPIIGLATFMPNTWSNEMIGNPSNPAYIPEPILPYTHRMTFLERCQNFIYGILAYVAYYFKQIPRQDQIMRKYFGDDLPSLKSMLSKTSLVLVNHHYSLAFSRAYLPNMVEVGGYHVKPPKPLPKDIQSFMDEAKDGVILFSMGSNLQSADFPEEKIQKILLAFGKLKQRVLWKFENENLPNLPSNVKISKWLPQNDILGNILCAGALAHSNTKVFITHGGLLSLTEAFMRGVPVVAIPIFGDQKGNVNFVTQLELGVRLGYDEISDHSLLKAINEVLSNPKYAKNMKERSRILQDVPIPQIDNALFWIEYVIRHKGASHLRSPAQDLSWYQVYLLDVIGFFAVLLYLGFKILWKPLKFSYRFFSNKRQTITKMKKF